MRSLVLASLSVLLLACGNAAEPPSSSSTATGSTGGAGGTATSTTSSGAGGTATSTTSSGAGGTTTSSTTTSSSTTALGSPATAQIGAGADALASYLISASPPAWNIFSGAAVPLGRHFDTGHVSYHTALRFAHVGVPRGATVTAAHLGFYPANSVDASHNLWIDVYAEKAGDSAPFDPQSYDQGRPDQRAKTTAKIDHWLVRCNATCTDLTEYDCPQRKLDCWDQATEFTCPKDLKALVQEVVSLPDWAPGNALTLLLVNAATDQDGAAYQSARSITGFDPARGAGFSPKLVIEWTP